MTGHQPLTLKVTALPIKRFRHLVTASVLLAGHLSTSVMAAQAIHRADTVEQLCRDASQASLAELGIISEHWQAEKVNDDGNFFIEGLWQTNAGQYLVECQLRYGGTEGQLKLQIMRDNDG